ncbi:MAG: hypothetical protein ACOCTG_02760 [Bacteroidota bacterium]
MATDRDTYVEKLKEQIDQWNAKIDELEQAVEQGKVESRVLAEERLKDLRYRRDDMRKRYEGLQESSGNVWDDLKRGADAAWQDLEKSFERARAEFE